MYRFLKRKKGEKRKNRKRGGDLNENYLPCFDGSFLSNDGKKGWIRLKKGNNRKLEQEELRGEYLREDTFKNQRPN